MAATATDFWAGMGHALAATAAVAVPCCVVWARGPTLASPVPGFVLVLCSIVAGMKVASFGHCCADLRGRAREAARREQRSRAAARGGAGGGRGVGGGGSGRLLRDVSDEYDLDDDFDGSSSQQQQQQLLASAAGAASEDGGGGGAAPGTPGRANDPQRLSAGGEGTTRRSRIAGAVSSSGDEQARTVFAAASRAAAARAAAAAGRGEGLTPVLTTTAELSEEEEQAGTAVETSREVAKNSASNSSLYPCYPDNLTAGNLAYFVAAPTLVYQTGYPRSPGTRASTRRLLWCSFKLSVAAALQAVIWVS